MNASIHFFAENIKYTIRDKKKLREWIIVTATAEQVVAGDINIILCEDEFLADMNVKYLKHNTLTDIITFPMMEDEHVISGDIFISLPRIRENAKKFAQSIENELHRVIIHGILHLAGYKDSAEDDKRTMREKENFYLDKLDKVL